MIQATGPLGYPDDISQRKPSQPSKPRYRQIPAPLEALHQRLPRLQTWVLSKMSKLRLVVGGRSARAVRRAARLAQGWFAVWLSPRRVRAAVEDLRAHAEEFRRPVCTTVMLLFAHVTEDAETGRAELQQFVAGQYGMPVEAIEKWCVIGSEARVADALAEYRDAGAESFVMMPTAVNVLEQYERLAAVRGRFATSV